jgi:hypothetical protein
MPPEADPKRAGRPEPVAVPLGDAGGWGCLPIAGYSRIDERVKDPKISAGECPARGEILNQGCEKCSVDKHVKQGGSGDRWACGTRIEIVSDGYTASEVRSELLNRNQRLLPAAFTCSNNKKSE